MFRVHTPIIRSPDVELQHMVFGTEFLDGWCSWEPLPRSCVQCGWSRRAAPSAPYTRPTQRLSRPPPIQKLGAENHMLQLNIRASDNRHMYPKHVELIIHKKKTLLHHVGISNYFILRSALFWDFTQLIKVVLTAFRDNVYVQSSGVKQSKKNFLVGLTLNMGPTGCSELSVRSHYSYSSPSSVAPLYKKDKHLSSCSPPSIPILRYFSPINNSSLSYVILYIFFPSSLESPLGSFFV